MSYPSRPPRYQTQIPVVVTHSDGPQAGCIVDINAYGACVAGIAGVAVGHKIHLRGEIESNIGSVRWATGDRIGVFFERMISAQRVAKLRFQDPAFMTMAATSGIAAPNVATAFLVQ